MVGLNQMYPIKCMYFNNLIGFSGGQTELHNFVTYSPLLLIKHCFILIILSLMSITFHSVHDIWLQMATNGDQIQRA